MAEDTPTGGKSRTGRINPTRDQFKTLMAMPDDGPVIMVNMLKYKPDGGRKSYARYERAIRDLLINRIGARLLSRGEVMMPVIGDEDWDDIFMVQYPSIAAFIEMQRDPEYQAAAAHRSAALDDSRLFMLRPTGDTI